MLASEIFLNIKYLTASLLIKKDFMRINASSCDIQISSSGYKTCQYSYEQKGIG